MKIAIYFRLISQECLTNGSTECILVKYEETFEVIIYEMTFCSYNERRVKNEKFDGNVTRHSVKLAYSL